MDNLARDVRFALRTLGRAPGFTVTAVLILALGIGVNATVFSAVNFLLLRGLNVPHADQLVRIFSVDTNRDASAQSRFSFPGF